jgi:Animal haem peroxidase
MGTALRLSFLGITALGSLLSVPDARAQDSDIAIINACREVIKHGPRPIADERIRRFEGKVSFDAVARCRGGANAVAKRNTPWLDWSNYWATGDASSKSEKSDSAPFPLPELLKHLLDRNTRGIDGALMDIEYQRMELIKFNLLDNATFQQYVTGRKDGKETTEGPILKTWKEMRLPSNHPNFTDVGGNGNQQCKGSLVRFRTLTGICNDTRNPAMGATGQLFGRQVQFETTYPELGLDQLTKNRHGERLSLLKPDPQVISRKLLTRDQSGAPNCNKGKGTGSADSDCDYKKAPFFNVIAAYWIQFMTHDWFTHMADARNDLSRSISMGCASERVNNVEQAITPARADQLGCRPGEKMEAALLAEKGAPPTFKFENKTYMARSPGTTRNLNTAWWDASQIYGYDETSRRRMRRDPADPAKLQLVNQRTGTIGDEQGYLPEFGAACAPGAPATGCDPIRPEWAGQEAAAMPDNWSIGLSFLHTVFVREHNAFVNAFRKHARDNADEDSGLRNPDRPTDPIPYSKVSNDELFEIARLVVAAEIAKIHTIEWTTQLLYDEPLYIGMNANWSGVFKDDGVASKVTQRIVRKLAASSNPKLANQFYSALAAGPGIFGAGSDLAYPEGINDGANHFGTPFNFPEEFMSVYRLHPLVPDMIEYRDLSDPNKIARRVPVIDTFRAKSTAKMRESGLSNWAVSMGRQRLGLLELNNHPQFLQNLDIRPRFDVTLDVPALDIIRDREHGVPRFNEFRRQIGLRHLSSFDDFIDKTLPADSARRKEQERNAATLREVYGQHKCDAGKVITAAQAAGFDPVTKKPIPINDCLGQPNGSTVDNVEDVDIVVGFVGEPVRPHGYAISETQFQIFILNASRRLFSDRFFTSSFRPEFYAQFGVDWVMNNGPDGTVMEDGEPNGHKQEVLPMKRVLLRVMPELKDELKTVVNAFDPWARDRGEYYTLDWKPRKGAESDPAFAK